MTTVSVSHLKDGRPDGTPMTVRCYVQASSLFRAGTWISASAQAVYSNSFVDVAVPFAMAALAMLVCLFKLAFFFPV